MYTINLTTITKIVLLMISNVIYVALNKLNHIKFYTYSFCSLICDVSISVNLASFNRQDIQAPSV